MYYSKTYSFGKTEMFAKKWFLLLGNKLAFPLGLCNGSLLVSAQEGITKVTQSVLCYYLQTVTAEKISCTIDRRYLYHRKSHRIPDSSILADIMQYARFCKSSSRILCEGRGTLFPWGINNPTMSYNCGADPRGVCH